jgi:hypothetical protein
VFVGDPDVASRQEIVQQLAHMLGIQSDPARQDRRLQRDEPDFAARRDNPPQPRQPSWLVGHGLDQVDPSQRGLAPRAGTGSSHRSDTCVTPQTPVCPPAS